jgi:hypothetical protein
MTISVKHAFASAKADGTDSTLIQPSNWNAEHTISLAAGKVLGRDSSGNGAMQELPLSFDTSGNMSMSATGSFIPAVGTTGQRPASPTAGMLRFNSTSTKVEVYNGTIWGSVGGGATISDTAPSSPSVGDIWWKSDEGQMYVYYTDANSSQWVVANAYAGGAAYLPLAGGTLSGTLNGTSASFSGTLGVTSALTGATANFSGTVAMGSSFLRNRLINGAMQIAQRGTSATITAGTTVPTASTGYPCVDRWFVYSTGANVTAAQVAGATNNKNLLQVTGAASVTAVGIGQRIEQLNSYDLAGQTCTLSVNIANSLLTTVTWTASYANTADTFGTIGTPTKTQIATGTFTVTSTLTQYTANIAVPAAATTGIEILFTVAAQTSGTWQIGNAQLEVGSVATPFERRQYGQEVALCQRYFERSYEQGTATGAVTTAGSAQLPIGASASIFQGIIPYVEKRAQPTLTFYDCAGNITRVTAFSAGGASQTDNNNVISTSSGGQRGGWIRIAALAAGTAVYHWVASAEL